MSKMIAGAVMGFSALVAYVSLSYAYSQAMLTEQQAGVAALGLAGLVALGAYTVFRD